MCKEIMFFKNKETSKSITDGPYVIQEAKGLSVAAEPLGSGTSPLFGRGARTARD